MTVEKPVKLLPNASFSRLGVYNTCPKQYKSQYLDKLPEPKRPVMLDRSGKPKPSAGERGGWIHDCMDDFINDRSEDHKHPNFHLIPEDKIKPPKRLISELLNIKPEVMELRRLKREDPDSVYTEQKWYFDLDWNEIFPEPGQEHKDMDYAVIAIIDAMVIDRTTDPDYVTARIIDLKSGKSYNNTAKHAKQLNLYAAAAAHKFPEIQEMSLELLYCDEGKHLKRPVTRDSALIYRNYWDMQILRMHKDKDFFPTASASNCRFCCRRPLDKPNKWVNGDGTCENFVEHPNDTKWREAL